MSASAQGADDRGTRTSMATVAVITISTFVLYALGACPTIYVGDSGELVTAVHLLGIPHPTGYPLYVLLGKAWTLLVPTGSIAWRMSLFSAACAAATCGALALIVARARLGSGAAALAALLLAASPSFWGEANVQRVYALGAFFVVAATGAAFAWHRSRGECAFALTAFLCGLGATNHTFMMVYAIAFGVFALGTQPSLIRAPRALGAAAAAFAVGLLPYVYLPLRSRANPRLDWGNPETLSAFLDVVLRRDFWDRAWVDRAGDFIPVLGDYATSVVTELTWPGVALAALGLITARRLGVPILLPLLVMAGNVLVVGLHGSRSDIFIWHRYYIPSYAMAALLAGVGGHVLMTRLPRAVGILLLAVPIAHLVTGWPDFDRRRYRVADAFAREVLRELPPGAHLAATDDNILFSLLYLHLVEGERPDIDLVPQGVGDAELRPLRFDPDEDPLYFTHHPNWDLPTLRVVPLGLVFRAVRAGMPAPAPVLPAGPLLGADDPRVPRDYLTQNLIGQFHYMLGITAEEREWPVARREFAAAAAAAPHNDVMFYNLGLIYRRNGLVTDALAAFARSAAVNPRHLASHSRPRAQDRVVELETERTHLAALEAKARAEDPALAALPPASPAAHRRLAEILDARGEPRFAHGHRLRAEEVEAAATAPSEPIAHLPRALPKSYQRLVRAG